MSVFRSCSTEIEFTIAVVKLLISEFLNKTVFCRCYGLCECVNAFGNTTALRLLL